MEAQQCLVTFLVCCSTFWLSSSSRVPGETPAPASRCNTMLSFSEVLTSSEGNGNIHSRSLSPWKWRRVTVKDQIPSVIWEAECSSSFCSSTNPEVSRSSLNSVPIYQNVLVLKRMQDGEMCYSASHHPVVVGCTCVRAKTTQS
ncbi:interleukin 17a/f2 [Genypterus blacodes]|uniref:interleukin 17a/f2 n=1 Tax=Genypterus blacodes TaxID=154954 RepID=UPI003F76AA14